MGFARLRLAARPSGLPVAEDPRGRAQRLARGAAAGERLELVERFVGEAGFAADLHCDRDRRVRALASRAAEAELLVDLAAELLGALVALGIVARELAHPVAAEAHVRELVGKHVVDRL